MRFYTATSFLFPRSLCLRILTFCFVTMQLPLLAVVGCEAASGRIHPTLLLLLALAAAVGMAAAASAIGGLIAPVLATTAALQALEAGKTFTPLPAGGRDLVGRLLQAVNRTAAATGARIQRLDHAAHRDPLTGLYNRRGLLACTETLLPDDESMAVALLDLDQFKRLNDRLGHDTGDRVLREIGQLLVAGLRKNDIVARWGGEEFAVLFPGEGEAEAAAALERIRACMIARPIAVVDGDPITFSGGVASMRPSELSMEASLIEADRAMYAVKRSGGNRLQVAP